MFQNSYEYIALQSLYFIKIGTRNYMERYSSSIKRVSSDFDPVPKYDEPTLSKVDEVSIVYHVISV